MSLLRLLATGKSLVSLRDTESRYRLTSQRLLPQFGPTRNPFHSPGNSELAVAGTLRPTAEFGKAAFEAGACGSARRLWLKAAEMLSVWMRKARAVIAGSLKKAGSAAPRFQKPPLQGELSLDRVKVMRNDLSEADRELVNARAKPASASLAGKAADRAEQIWGQVSDRLFPAGKV
jgi:hypothetical protein